MNFVHLCSQFNNDNDMKHLDFDELWQNHLFDYKDGDLLVIDDLTRLDISKYENTTLTFVLAVFCVNGRILTMVDGQEYRLENGNFFIYLPGQLISEIMLSGNAQVKVIAFAQRAIDQSLYLNKYIWENMAYVKQHQLFALSDLERQGINHYYQLLMLKKQGVDGNFHHDVVRLLFQALMLEFLMLIDRRRQDTTQGDTLAIEKDSSVRQSMLIYRRFMRLLAESDGRVRSVSSFAEMLNITPKYPC